MTDKQSSVSEKINPFSIMVFLYLFVGTIAAIQAALILYGVIANTNTIVWVRIHFITLGVMTQLIFGYVPKYLSKSDHKSRGDIWLILNSGIIMFFYGRSLLNEGIMITGGTFVFIATSLFLAQIIPIRKDSEYSTHLFYIFATVFLLTGIILGTGIWTGWKEPLKIFNALEAHIHAQNWGFLSLVFAGLLLDLYPKFSGKQIDNPDNVNKILILLTFGGFALVLSPWMGGEFAIPIAVLGMISFIVGTVMLLLNMTRPLKGEKKDIGLSAVNIKLTKSIQAYTFSNYILYQ